MGRSPGRQIILSGRFPCTGGKLKISTGGKFDEYIEYSNGKQKGQTLSITAGKRSKGPFAGQKVKICQMRR
jgi:hypothetical protein